MYIHTTLVKRYAGRRGGRIWYEITWTFDDVDRFTYRFCRVVTYSWLCTIVTRCYYLLVTFALFFFFCTWLVIGLRRHPELTIICGTYFGDLPHTHTHTHVYIVCVSIPPTFPVLQNEWAVVLCLISNSRSILMYYIFLRHSSWNFSKQIFTDVKDMCASLKNIDGREFKRSLRKTALIGAEIISTILLRWSVNVND